MQIPIRLRMFGWENAFIFKLSSSSSEMLLIPDITAWMQNDVHRPHAGTLVPGFRWQGSLSAKVYKNTNLGYSHDRDWS